MQSSPPVGGLPAPIDKCGPPRRPRVKRPRLTFYAGVNEIGGNKILLEDRGTRVFLDFGMQMGKLNDYFDEFAQPRGFTGMGDLMEFGLLPKLAGIYRKDYARHSKYGNGDHKKDTSVDAVLLSHAHVDHCAYIHYLRPEIPIYCSEESRLIMQCFQDTGGREEYVRYKENYKLKGKKGAQGRAKGPKDREERERKLVSVKPGRFKIDSIEVEAIPIDHSLPGVYGFLIHTSQGSVGYTADIRYHGRRRKDTEAFVEKCRKERLDHLLCEGTRIDAVKPSKTEYDMEKGIAARIKKTENLVVCTYPTRDLDRFLSFYNAAKAGGRKLAVDTKQAYLLKLFRDAGIKTYPDPKDKHLATYVSRKSWGLLDRKGYGDKLVNEDYKKWERQFLDWPNRVGHGTVGEKQKEYVLYCSDFTLMNLIDIRPKAKSSYIRSSTEPFDDEMHLDRDRVKRWLVHFGLLRDKERLEHVHVSGHGTADQIAKVVRESDPKSLTPIHTEHPEMFDGLHPSVSKVAPGGSLDVGGRQ